MRTFDVIIVGAGPAGLTAATYLGRYRRNSLVLDGGAPRAAWIPESHNTPGFPGGIGGVELLRRLREQAERYGAEIRPGRAGALEKTPKGFELRFGDKLASAPYILLATGIVDEKPKLAGVDKAIERSLVRVCPICDAYEAIDRRIAVLGDDDLGAREALFLRTYSERVTLLHLGDQAELTDRDELDATGVEILPTRLAAISLEERAISVADERGPQRRTFDFLYLALGCKMQGGLALQWGAAHGEDHTLLVDAHQRTSIDGLYAAGDVVRGLNQITVAAAEAAIAATDIHNRLRK